MTNNDAQLAHLFHLLILSIIGLAIGSGLFIFLLCKIAEFINCKESDDYVPSGNDGDWKFIPSSSGGYSSSRSSSSSSNSYDNYEKEVWAYTERRWYYDD